jgi:hypothetical protein
MDSWICQTSTASPAEPGASHFGLGMEKRSPHGHLVPYSFGGRPEVKPMRVANDNGDTVEVHFRTGPDGGR